MNRSLLFALPLLLAACDDGTATCSDDPVTAACSYALDSKASCLAEGGCWGTWGLEAGSSCNCPTTDAGEPCSSDADCEGLCLHYEYDDNDACSQDAQGTCADMQRSFGCFCTYEDSAGWQELCAD